MKRKRANILYIFFSFYFILSSCEKKRTDITISPSFLLFECGVKSLTLLVEGEGRHTLHVLEKPLWANVFPSSGEFEDEAELKVSVNEEDLFAGSETGSIKINIEDKIYEVDIYVEKCLYGIEISPSSISFEARDIEKEVILYTFSPSPINWVSSSDSSWVIVEPPFGTVNPGELFRIKVRVERRGLGPGTYHSQVSFYASDVTSVLNVRMVKADYPIIYFPSTQFYVNECDISVTFPYINLGTGSQYLTCTSGNLLTAFPGWFKTEEEGGLLFSVSRTGLFPGTYRESLVINGLSQQLNADIEVKEFLTDWYYIETLSPPSGITTYSDSITFTVSAKTFISSSNAGGDFKLMAYLSGNPVPVVSSTPVNQGLHYVDSLSLTLTNLKEEEFPIYLVIQLVSNSGKGVPETIFSYPLAGTYYVFLKEIEHEPPGFIEPDTVNLKAVLEYSVVLTSSVGLYIYDEYRNILAYRTFETSGSGITAVTASFNISNCTEYIIVEGRVYEKGTGEMRAREARIFKTANRYSNFPDYFEPSTISSPFDTGKLSGEKFIYGNFHEMNESDFYTFKIESPVDLTIFTQSTAHSPDPLNLCLWDRTFTSAITCGVRRDIFTGDIVAYASSLSPDIYGISITSPYNFYGTGTEYVLYMKEGSFDVSIESFSVQSTDSLARYFFSVTNPASFSINGLRAGVFLNKCPPQSSDIPLVSTRFNIDANSSSNITLTYPCEKDQIYTACAKIWGKSSWGDSTYTDPLTFQCR